MADLQGLSDEELDALIAQQSANSAAPGMGLQNFTGFTKTVVPNRPVVNDLPSDVAGLAQPPENPLASLSDVDLDAQIAKAQGSAQPPTQVAQLQQAFDAKKAGLGRTMFDQAMQGGTFGFADEAMDGLGALIAGAATLQDPRKLVPEARALSQERLSNELKTRPVASIAANIGGGLLTGGAGATTKAGAALTNSLRGGTLAAKAAKGAIAGSSSGGVYGLGSGEDGERLSSAGSGAVLGAAFGGALPVAGAGLNKLNTKTIIPGSDEIRTMGSALFKKAEQEGGVIQPQVADAFRNKVLSRLNLDSEAKLYASNPVAERLVSNIQEYAGKPLTFTTAKQIDENLGDLAYSTMDNFGKLDAQGKKFLDLQHDLREAMDTLPNNGTLKEAKKLWSTSLKMQDIERIISKAQSKEQPVTAIKNGFSNLLNRGDKLKGYSPEEIKAIEKASKTGVVTDLVKLAGSGLVPIGSAIAGSAGGPFGAAMAGGTGFLVQQGSKAMGVARQTARANKASEAVARSAGLVKTQPRISKDTLQLEFLKKKLSPKMKNSSALRTPSTFNVPNPPSGEILKSRGRVETVDLTKVMANETKREWGKFNKGEHPGELIKGYGDKPVAVKFANGEYLIFDGHHRTESALKSGKNKLDMHVVDVKDYAPGKDIKASAKSKIDDDELLRELMGDDYKGKKK